MVLETGKSKSIALSIFLASGKDLVLHLNMAEKHKGKWRYSEKRKQDTIYRGKKFSW
jgi:hypothetical protein